MQIFNFVLTESSTVKKLTVLKILKYTLGMVLVARFSGEACNHYSTIKDQTKVITPKKIYCSVGSGTGYGCKFRTLIIYLSEHVRIQPNWSPYKTEILAHLVYY
jgi:hypothetical protein